MCVIPGDVSAISMYVLEIYFTVYQYETVRPFEKFERLLFTLVTISNLFYALS